MANELTMFLVGSVEKHLIVDRAFTDKAAAIAYCNSRRNDKYAWMVVEIGDGAPWLTRKVIHHTEKS